MTPDPVVLTPDTSVVVHLAKHPRPAIEYPAVVLHDDGDHVVVRAPWFGDGSRDMGFAVFEPGDMWTEHFWRTRWFSVKEVRAADGSLKGWYCDVARPAVVEGAEGVTGVGGIAGFAARIVVADLELDLWLAGDGVTVLRLDEDEFAASGLTEREPEVAARALRTFAELEALARSDGFGRLLAW